jgi:hypothetical protein
MELSLLELFNSTWEKNLEELGTWQVQILHVDGGTQKMLGS